MHKKLEMVIKLCALATFFVPIIVIPSSYIFPFIVPKIIWFRSLSFVMLGLYLVLLNSNWSKYKAKRTPINVMVGLFLASFAISTFVGADWYRSLWDNHERMLGLFTIFHYVAYYLVLTAVVKDWTEWKWLMRVFLGAGSVVMVIAALQTHVDHDLLLNQGGTARVASTLGNAIYLSGYGLFLMFLGMFLAVKEKVKKQNIWFWYAVVGALLGFWGIFLGGTRGALLGFIAGIGVLAVSYLLSLKEHKRAKQIGWGVIILGALLLSTLFAYRQTTFVQNIPAVGRLLNTEISSSNTRIMAWGVAIDSWKDKPLFGWGPNNYYYSFNKHYRADFLDHGWGETWFDNAHSVVMNTLAVQGLFGIIIYLGLYIAAITMLWRAFRRGDIDAHVASIGTAFLVAHLVSLITVFENPTSYLYFFFMLALLNAQATPNTDESTGTQKSITTPSIVSMGIIVLIFVYSTNINPAKANQATVDALRGFSSGKDVVSLYQKATEIPSPHIDDIRNDFSRSASNAIYQLLEQGQNAVAQEFFDVARTELKKNIELHPLDIRVNIMLAQMDVIGAEINQDASLLFEAEALLTDALELSPKRQQIQYTLAGLKTRLGKMEEAIALLQDSIDNNPKIAEGWWRKALILNEIGRSEEAKQTILDAKESGIVFEGTGLQVEQAMLQAE